MSQMLFEPFHLKNINSKKKHYFEEKMTEKTLKLSRLITIKTSMSKKQIWNQNYWRAL